MEYMVRKKQTPKDHACRIGMLVLICFVISTVFFFRFAILVAGILGAIAYFIVFPNTDIEYEYLYCDKMITVDKILAQKKRKNVATYKIDEMEILAPVNSYRLNEYKNRKLKEVPLWSLMDSEEHQPYAMIYKGNQKIILDLPEKFVKIVQSDAPRKVYFD